MSRPKVSVYMGMSLDGYIAGEDHALDWLNIVDAPGEDYGFASFFAGVDTMLIGRNTYDVVLGFPEWPYAGKRVVVLTGREAAARQNEEFRTGPLPALLEELGRTGARHVYADGGRVVSALLNETLVDEMTVSIIPIVLGAGIPLFLSGIQTVRLDLVESRGFPTGLVQVKYRPGRATAAT